MNILSGEYNHNCFLKKRRVVTSMLEIQRDIAHHEQTQHLFCSRLFSQQILECVVPAIAVLVSRVCITLLRQSG